MKSQSRHNQSRHARSPIVKRLKLGLSYCLSLASVLAISAEAIAVPVSAEAIAQEQTAQATQTAETNETQTAQSAQESDTATSDADRLRPFFNLSHTEGGGFTGFTSVGGFLPLFQTPGKNVTFLDGRVNVDNDGNFGGGLQAGYRSLLNDSTIWGAFAGVDASGTGDSSFTQATAGTELLGENWDLTLNANIPLGNARQVVDSDIQAANPQFTGNQLLIDEQQIDQVQAALTTVSLDGGLELFDFGEGSGLWGRGGVYYLAGEASEDSLGFRASLDYRPKNNLRFAVGVQNDGIFDTNVTFSVNALLGSSSRRRSYDADEQRPTEDRSQLWARAAEPINRTNTVLIENQTDVEILQTDVTAINPETGNAFVFRHVDPAASNAVNGELAIAALEPLREGTFEDPLSTIAQAAIVADANADNIIFVQEGNAGGGFTLPDGVQVRSVGPIQQVNTQFGEAILPGSGSGNLPTVTGQVTIGNNTLVSGLEIDPTKFVNGAEVEFGVAAALEPPVVNGIEANGENITIEDNVIANVDTGINLPDIDGTVSIVRNQISNTQDDGIFFDDIEGEDNVTVTIADNTLDTTGQDGIEFDFFEGNANATITVTGNQISNVGGVGIEFNDFENDTVSNITIANNNILNADEEGIEFEDIENNANATITVTGNQITNVNLDGIEFDDIENDTVSNITVANNSILGTGTQGIEFDRIENNANTTINITGNQIENAGDEGIQFDDIENDTVSNITIADNKILGAGTQGIEFDFIENNANATINILNNQIENAGEQGILVGEIDGTATAVITVDGNTITDPGDDGIEFSLIEENANVTATVTNNTIINPGTTTTPVENPSDFPSVVIDPPNTDDDELEDEDLAELEASASAVAGVAAAEEVAAAPEPDGDGVRITHTADTDMCLALDNNTVINPASDGFDLISNGAGQFQVIDLANVTGRNVGTFNPADIEANDGFVEGKAGTAPCS
ncbi:MAG: right-handed parallel beta-helix repeat-containing protein [Phormidesmis sp.]